MNREDGGYAFDSNPSYGLSERYRWRQEVTTKPAIIECAFLRETPRREYFTGLRLSAPTELR
jgi:hypothetical protein